MRAGVKPVAAADGSMTQTRSVVAAYADPPYPNMAGKYTNHPDYAGEVDHAALLRRLCSEFDRWALSTASTTLGYVLGLPECPSDVRIGAWVKPWCSIKPNGWPGYAWEPVLFYGAPPIRGREAERRDFTITSITLQRGVIGAKPAAFCYWIFDFLGLTPSDALVDLFPGSGAVSRAWTAWQTAKRDQMIAGQLWTA